MSEKRHQDPLRRTPPTIDLKAEVMPPKTEASATSGEDVATAVEPVASTGLGPDPFPKSAAEPSAATGIGASGPPRANAATGAKSDAAAKASEASGKSASAASSAAASGSAAVKKPSPGEASKPAEAPKAPESSKGGDAAKASDPAPPPAAKAAEAGKPGLGPSPTGPAVRLEAGTDGAKSDESAKGAASAKPATAAEARKATGPVAPTQREPARPPRSGLGAMLTAGIIGGLLGAVLAVALTRVLPLPVERAVEERLAAVEGRVAALPSGREPLAPRIAALETALKQAAEDAKSARSAAEAATKQAAEAANRPAGSGADSEARSGLEALKARVEANAEKAEAAATGLGDLDRKLAALGGTTSDRMASIGRDVETLATHQKSLQTDVAALRSGTATLDTRAAEADKRLASLTEGLGRVSADLARLSPAAVQAGLRVVVSGRLDDALRSGTPLGPAISALTKLGTEAASLAPLRTFAEAPAPSAAALAAEFKPLAAAMTTEPPRQDETWMDKGRRLLGKVVTVQAIGDGSGQDVPGLVARIDSSLARGAVADAKAAWDRLPEDKRRLSAAWGEKLAARAAAEDAARRIGAQSLSALDAATR